jgi:hypothetical protein
MASELSWRKSSYSGSQGGNCLEVTDSQADRILVRDTKDRSGPILPFSAEAWRRFAMQLKSLADNTKATPSEITRGGRSVCRTA